MRIPPPLTRLLATVERLLVGGATSNWTDIPGVEISIPGRGEEIVYREAGREFHFEISCDQLPLVLYTRTYWDGDVPMVRKHLEEADRARLIPRLVAYLGCKGEPVVVRDE
jgi:hypothetical protein